MSFDTLAASDKVQGTPTLFVAAKRNEGPAGVAAERVRRDARSCRRSTTLLG